MSRILDCTDIVECGHTRFERKWSLTSQECEQTVSDLFVGIRKTLPVLVERIHDEIGNKTRGAPWTLVTYPARNCKTTDEPKPLSHSPTCPEASA
jgi:hypothetical protein